MKNSNLEFVRALIKEMNDSYKSVEEKKKLSGGQSKIATAAPPEDEITAADFKALRAKKGMEEDQEVSEGLGNDIGDKVYFRSDSNFGKKFPSSDGYYAIIQDVTPASNYNMNALYKVVVHDKDDNEIGAIRADWTNFSNKPINENHEGQDHEVSMANNSLDSILWAVGELKKHLGDQERDIPAWIQDHITNAENYITQAAKNFHDYGAEEPTEEPAKDMSLASLMEVKKKAAIKLPKKKAAKKK